MLIWSVGGKNCYFDHVHSLRVAAPTDVGYMCHITEFHEIKDFIKEG